MSAAPFPVPPGVNIHQSRQPQLWASIIITYSLAVVAVALRFWSRKLSRANWGLDDWLIVVSLAIAAGFSTSLVIWITQGYGRHLWVLNPTFLAHFFKNLFVGEILYTLVIVTVKYSILAFYYRIFNTKAVRIQALSLSALTTAWGIAVVLVTIFQCIPVSGFWNKMIHARCFVDDYAFFVGIAVPNIVTDALILAMPVPQLLRLQRTTSQKIALIGIFMLGGFVCIISIVRLVSLVDADLQSPDLDWNFAPIGVWTVTESNIAIVSACLPSLKPILSFTMTGSPSASARARNYQLSRYSGRTAPGNGSKAGRGDSRNRGDHDTERLFFSAAGKVDPSGQYSPMADEISNRMTTAPPRPGMDEGGGGGYLAS